MANAPVQIISSISPEPHGIDLTSINTIPTLSMDGVQAANSGHPGTPMALAPVAYCLWQRFLRFDPQDPVWPNRDRFILSMRSAQLVKTTKLSVKHPYRSTC
jgi:transketolase